MNAFRITGLTIAGVLALGACGNAAAAETHCVLMEKKGKRSAS
jgi:hypothetical protein